MNINNNDLLSFNDGFSIYEIDQKDDLTFRIDNSTNSNVFIRIINASKINIEGHFNNDCKTTILFWNDSNNDLDINESYTLDDNCDISLAYGECNNSNTKRQLTVEIKGTDSNASVNTASLINTDKQYRIKVINDNRNTHGNINNYAVLLNNGKLMIDAVGKINKGAKKSTSHQVSRALSFEQGQTATILPELLIDENDVQASHAMSIGRVDEKQLYYMMSRGLDIKQCTTLISLGYLLPILDFISDEELKETMKNELERKIMETCSM